MNKLLTGISMDVSPSMVPDIEMKRIEQLGLLFFFLHKYQSQGFINERSVI